MTDYSQLSSMFRHLKTLEPRSAAHERQRAAICEQCLPVADHIARRYRNRGQLHEDLVQVARIGLVQAINRFDVDNGADFLSFAVPTMMGEVRRHFRDHSWAVRVPRSIKDLQPRVNQASAELTQRLGHAPTASEIADHTGIDRELVIQVVIASSNYSTLSIDRPRGADGDSESYGSDIGSEDTGFDRVLQVETVRPLIAALPERERTILTLKFFENMTQSQIADRVGYSQMHVSRILAKALATLRNQVREPDLAAAS